MAKQTSLNDLNDHLFAHLERLDNEQITPEQMELEVKRGETIVAISDQIIRNAGLQLQAAKLLAEHGNAVRGHLPMLENKRAGTPPPEGRPQ